LIEIFRLLAILALAGGGSTISLVLGEYTALKSVFAVYVYQYLPSLFLFALLLPQPSQVHPLRSSSDFACYWRATSTAW